MYVKNIYAQFQKAMISIHFFLKIVVDRHDSMFNASNPDMQIHKIVTIISWNQTGIGSYLQEIL